jgi:hypothetical protein
LQEYVQKGTFGSSNTSAWTKQAGTPEKRFTICVRPSGAAIGEGTGLNKPERGTGSGKSPLDCLGVLEYEA